MSEASSAVQERQAPPAKLLSGGRIGWCLAGLAVLLGCWWLGDVLVGPNLTTVIPGRVYRGAQPTAKSVERLVRDYGIRTIVNLRGSCNPLPWYLDEAGSAQRLGINQEDVSFSAVHLPAPGELRQLVEVLERAEYPIFLHCRHGADRTGMAAAMVLLLQKGVPYARARRELGLYCGHLSFGKTGNLDRFFDEYEAWLHATGKEHAPAVFRHWVLAEYRGGWCAGEVEHAELLAPAQAGHPIGFRVRLHNRSQAIWQFQPTATAGVHVVFRVWDEHGNGVVEGRAGLLEASVAPGERFEVTMVVPPLRAGRYRIAVDLVEEYHCWFSQAGAELCEEEFTVRE